jgi:hypothetical protein
MRFLSHLKLIPRRSFLIPVLLLAGCGAGVAPLIPTAIPTATATLTPTLTRTPDSGATPTITPTSIPITPTGGPSPTPLFGASATPGPNAPTPTRVLNPNAPRIEFFTSNSAAVEPGSSLTLFWSTRGADNAVIYRLDSGGARNQLWNVGPDGSLTVPTKRSDRGQVDFVLSVGEGALITEQTLSIPLACPITWFFSPALETCPKEDAQPTTLIDEPFERGRMLYVEARNTVYALFNDGKQPAWVAFDNRYDPAKDPESLDSFVPPPGFYQPIRVLGFVWRGNDAVRNRLGLGTAQESTFDGFVQTGGEAGGTESLYLSTADGKVVQLLPGGDQWQIITPP